METELKSYPKSSLQIYSLNERAITIEFGSKINDELFKQISAYNKILNTDPFIGFKTTVPAYTTLTVFYDPLAVLNSTLAGMTAFEKVSNYLIELANKNQSTTIPEGKSITIPVLYGGEFGPDIEEVASSNQLSVDEVIKLHSATTYKVYMMGFVPGFAYLGGMNNKLTTPRKAQPRAVIPAGSVGIAAEQTGIYPLETPGGWQIIGQSPLKLFDAFRNQPSLLSAGDEVVFKPITLKQFHKLSGN